MDLSLRSRSVIQEIVSIVEAFLKVWLAEEGESQSLEELEERLLGLLRRIGPVLLAWKAQQMDEQLRPSSCSCGGKCHSQGPRPRALETRVGPVKLKRAYYKCRECGRCWHPLDDAWQLLSGCLSPGAWRAAVEFATVTTFREGQALMERWTGVGVSVSTVWRAAQRAGERLVQAQMNRLQETSDRKGAAAFLRAMREPGQPGRWAMAVDGLFLRIGHQWREVKIAVVGQVSESGEWVKGATTYLATTHPADTFRKLLRHHAHERGITWQSTLVLLSDGAEWIKALPGRFFPNALHILDFWHASQYLFRAGQLLYGEGTPKARAFGEEMKGWLRKRTVQEILDRLERERKRLKIDSGKRYKELLDVARFLANHVDCMDYDDYRGQNWPIGSGPAEAACKTLVQCRMKRAGMNWSLAGAANMLALRAQYYTRLNALLSQRS